MKKVIITLCIVLALLLGVNVGMLVYMNTPAQKASRQLKLAQRYLEEMEYEEAIAVFQTAIDIEPRNEEAWIGIVEAYICVGDYESALEYAEHGYEQTDSDDLQDRIDDLHSGAFTDYAGNEHTWTSYAEQEATVEETDTSEDMMTAAEADMQQDDDVEKLYMQFLNGELEAVVDYEYGSLEMGASLTYEEMQDAAIADKYSTLELERWYTIAENVFGKKLLLLKFQNLGIYMPEDDSYRMYVLAVNDGCLEMTYVTESSTRSWTEVCEGLILTYFGNGGAGDIYSGEGYLDNTGHYQELYSLETLYADWVAMEDSALDTSWSANCTAYLLDLPDARYFAIEQSGDVDADKLNMFIANREAEGRTQTDDIDGLIQGQMDSIGAPDTLENFENWMINEGL